MSRRAPTPTSSPLAAVTALGKHHGKAQQRVREVREQLNTAIVAASAAGESEVALARASGLGRITVRRILGKPYSRGTWPPPNKG